MVRKRTRRYDSDENESDSDVDINLEQPSKTEPKRYSLRERKRTFFTTDFDYYGLDDDDAEAKKQSSDDEDFKVQTGAEDADQNGAATAYFEPDPDIPPENAEGLIDFEDIIRADIVVNKNKIDYDNLIQKTEIKLTQATAQASPPRQQQKKRRGRPPKNRSNDSVKQETETQIECQPDLGTAIIPEENIENQNTGGVEEEEEESGGVQDAQESLPNGEIKNSVEGKNESQEPLDTQDLNKVQKNPPEEVKEIVKMTDDDDDDDDVILLEEKQPVIVLDD